MVTIDGNLVEKISTKTQKPYKVFECVITLPNGYKFETLVFPSLSDNAIITALSGVKGGK